MSCNVAVNFGALVMPAGYKVIWCEGVEHYLAVHEASGWESDITWDRFQARRWCIKRAEADYA